MGLADGARDVTVYCYCDSDSCVFFVLQHSIRDAITPSPAFIAVPSTPPPVKDSPTKNNQQSSPSKKLEISAPTLLPSGSNPFSNDAVTLASRQPVPKDETGAANYSLVGAAEDDEEYVESEAEPGYATVARHTGTASRSREGAIERSRNDGGDGGNHLSVEDRPRLATPRHEVMTEQSNIRDEITHRNSKDGAGVPPSTHEQGGHQNDFQDNQRRSLSPIARQMGQLGGAAHSYDSIDNAAILPRNEIQPKMVDASDERQGHNGQVLHVPQQPQTETMYTKVVKPRKQEDKGHPGRSSRDVVATASGHLPPIGPQSSPPNRRGGEKEKSKSPRDLSHSKKMNSPRDSSSPHRHHHHRSRSHSNGRHSHHHASSGGSQHHSRADGGVRAKSKSSSKGRSRSNSMPLETHDHTVSTRNVHQQHRQRSESYSHTAQPPGSPMEDYYYEEEDDIDLPLEYTDHSYLGEESETFTTTESYFHDLYGEIEDEGVEGEFPGDYADGTHVTPNRRHRTRQRGEHGHRRSRSATFPGHLEPHHSVSKRRVPSPHAAHYSSGHNRSPSQKRQKRPASSGEMPLDNDIPFLRPPSLQPVYPIPQNQVYVFSELQPDGSVQYYSATPVNSPPVISPPPCFNALSPLQQAPPNSAPPIQLQVPPTIAPRSPHPSQVTTNTQQQQSSISPVMNTSPSPHKNVHVRVEEHEGTHSATAQARAASPLDQAKFNRRIPIGITESGYFSSALASSQQGLAMGQAGAVFSSALANSQQGVAMGQAGAVSPAIEQERVPTSGGVPHTTTASPRGVQFNSHLSPSPNLQSNKAHHLDDQHLMVESPRSGTRSKSPQVSPSAKLLESSLQAANISSHSASPITKSSRGTKRSKSPRLNTSLDSGTAARQGSVGITALYEQKERVLKARIKALEDSTVELCTENASLKQLCEALKQDASKSTRIASFPCLSMFFNV